MMRRSSRVIVALAAMLTGYAGAQGAVATRMLAGVIAGGHGARVTLDERGKTYDH
jgi:hypothetical protein